MLLYILKVIKGGISDSNLSVSARSNVVRGQLDATAHRGVATFDSLVVTAPPGNYMVSFHGDNIKSVEVCSHEGLELPAQSSSHFYI